MLTALLLSFPEGSLAQAYKGSITVRPVRLEQRGDSLYVGVDVHLDRVRVKSQLSVDLAPLVVLGDGVGTMPVISVKGRNNYKDYQRSLLLDKALMRQPYMAIKGFGGRTETVRYEYAVAYQDWMADSQFRIVREVRGCGESGQPEVSTFTDRIDLDLAPYYPPAPVRRPSLAYVKPEVEAVKTREIQAECRLDFIVNKTNIDPSYMNNPRELASIKEIIDELKNDPAISVKALEIIGYASPEGSLAGNKRLSEGRATALRDYLASQYDFPMSAYRITFGGENWDGLVKALETYPLQYKDEVLAVIENNQDAQTRKSRLQALRGGVPYRDMLKNIYPGLRTAICVIDYEIKGFDLQEALVVFRTRPQNLSLNELYLVANTMEEDTQGFVDVFETAVRMYPEDGIANLNAAVAALYYGNTEPAERYLAKATQLAGLPEYENALGALAYLNKDYETAERYFRRAAEAGLEAAASNLEILPESDER